MPVGVYYRIPLNIFWKLNPKKLERYEAYLKEQLKQSHDEMKESGWINGLYVQRAIQSCFPSGGKYPETPMEIWRGADEAEENTEAFTDADRFAAWATTFNKNKFG